MEVNGREENGWKRKIIIIIIMSHSSHYQFTPPVPPQAPRPSTGPHKLRESLPLILILRNRLKYALTKAEANAICKQKFVKVDGKVRTDLNYPAGFMGK